MGEDGDTGMPQQPTGHGLIQAEDGETTGLVPRTAPSLTRDTGQTNLFTVPKITPGSDQLTLAGQLL